MKIMVSVSGGKDSTAMVLNLLDKGYSDFEMIFADTGWESESTYTYLEYLENKIKPIIKVKSDIAIVEKWKDRIEYLENLMGFESPMIRWIYKQNCFPSGARKWCTTKLKMEPITKYYQSIDCDVVNLVGIRKEESHARSMLSEWDWNEKMFCWTHRPLIDWKESDVIDIHKKFDILPNNLYLTGSSRVGCYPCIYARKQEILNLSEKRIQIIEMIENDLNITFFKNGPIQKMIKWSKTERGGKQYFLFNPYQPTCEKWGLCDFSEN